MGFFSDLFGGGGDGGGWERIPSTPEQDRARRYLESLYKAIIQYPTRVVPGMTGLEEEGQKLIQQYIQQPTPTGVTQSLAELSKTVTGGYDPLTSPEYAGYRATSKLEESEAVNALKRLLQLKGMPVSSPALAEEGKVRQGYSAMRLQKLGELISQERMRQLYATEPLAALSRTEAETPLRYAGAAATFGAIPREIETERERAIWEALVETLLFPYIRQAPLAATILKEPGYAWMTEAGGSSGLGGIVGQLAGSIIPGLFGGGGGSSGGGSSGGGMDWGQIAMQIAMAAMMSSDLRLKENLSSVENSLEKVKKLKGYTYNFKGQNRRSGGIIAQDLEEVLPEGVVEINGVKMINLNSVVALLVNAVNELSAKIN